MAEAGPVRWGILSTAHIAASNFLPSLRASGNGVAYAVAGRDLERARSFAAENGVEQAIEGYVNLLTDDRVEAVYNPLPNALHAEWTVAALRAGKAVLCEKPLCVSVEQTKEVLDVARQTRSLLWEAFVFPFQAQTQRVEEIIASGQIGELREIHSDFHFALRGRDNIRLSPQLAGGALNDVGCYCIRLADFLFGTVPTQARALARWAAEGVDEEMAGVLTFPGDKRLLFSASMFSAYDTLGRILGSEGEVRLSNPFHPRPHDTLEIWRDGESQVEHLGSEEPTFTPALRHINNVLRGVEQPRHLAIDEALPTAIGMELARLSAEQ